MDEITFNGLSLAARPGRVMTPRPASEQLVAAAVERIGSRALRVVDVGTGSGAIAVAIAAAAPSAQVFATDTSRCAVALARANVRRHGLENRVTVLHGDLLEPVPGPIDVVVANLPYLPAADAGRYPELVDEPPTAVFAPGDGLDPYRRLLAACVERLDDDADVLIQLHRQVLAATGAELRVVRASLEPLALAA
ncbi:MAG TPA: HemK family protein methyltransferase [Gaiellaceae bacterium]|nr:HemK family protein methyltransferase [Gaiellaceae bacterium]